MLSLRGGKTEGVPDESHSEALFPSKEKQNIFPSDRGGGGLLRIDSLSQGPEAEI